MSENDFNLVERFFIKTGMGYGELAPLKRFIFGACAITIPIVYLKPTYFFEPSGQPKKWSVLNADDPNSVYFPWWSSGLIIGAILSLLI